MKDTAARAVCTLKDRIPPGDHWILFGTLVDGGHDHSVQLLNHCREYRQI